MTPLAVLVSLALLGLTVSAALWWRTGEVERARSADREERTQELLQLHRRRAYLDEALDALGRAPVELTPELDGKLRLELPLPASWRIDVRPWNVAPPSFEPELTAHLGPQERLRIQTGVDKLATELHAALSGPLSELAGRNLHLGIRDGSLYLEAPSRPDALPIAKLVSALEALPTTLWSRWTLANGFVSTDDAITGQIAEYPVLIRALTQPRPTGQVRIHVPLHRPIVGLRWAERHGAGGAWSHDGDMAALQRRLRPVEPALLDALFRAYPRSRLTFSHIELVIEYWPTPDTLGVEVQRTLELARALDRSA